MATTADRICQQEHCLDLAVASVPALGWDFALCQRHADQVQANGIREIYQDQGEPRPVLRIRQQPRGES